jgi:recombinational DNA repair protein RecR
MTYLDLLRDADRQLDDGRITIGEYERMIKPLECEVQPEIVRCGECVNFAERDFCKVAGHNVHRKSNCMQVFGAERRTDGSV